MAQNIVLNGVVYTIPDTGEEDWGENLTDYFVAIPQGVLQKSGGLFTLTADVNFGANFGLLVAYLKSRGANISSTGLIRLARTDLIGWRNAANDGDLTLSVDANNLFTFGSGIVSGGAVTVPQISTPSTPGAGLNRLYPKSDGNFYNLAPSGVETLLGSGSGGAKNYLGTVNNINGNGNFELGSTSKWSLSHSTLDSTTKLPNQASASWTAAAGTLALTAVSSGQLAGSYSASYASSGATTAGDMLVSDAFTIDIENQSKVMTFQMYYKAVTNPTNGNFSGTSSNSFGIAIYDVTNSTWIQPAGVWAMTQNSGVGYATGTFQTTSNSTQYRIAVYNANATSGAITLYFDDFYLGPQTAPFGPVVTDWQAYTLTITGSTSNPSVGTNTANQAYWRRVGDSVQIEYTLKQTGAGSAGSGDYLFSLPSGLSIDTAKVVSISGAGVSAIGSASLYNGNLFTGTANIYSTTNTSIAIQLVNSSGGNFIGSGFQPLSSATYQLGFTAMVPIAGWSSNVQMSNDTDTRVIAASMGTGNPASATAGNPIIFPTTVFDTTASYNNTTGRYTVPCAGIYRIHGYIDSPDSGVVIRAYVDAVANTYLGETISTGDGAYTGLVKVNAGQFLDIRPDATIDCTSASTLNIERLSGPSVIAATDTVACRVKTASSQSIPNNTETLIVFDSKDYDLTNSFSTSTGIFTAPISGKYEISSLVTLTSAAWAGGNSLTLRVQKNSATSGIQIGRVFLPAATFAPGSNGCTDISLLAGETLAISLQHNQGGAVALPADSNVNWICIKRVGN